MVIMMFTTQLTSKGINNKPIRNEVSLLELIIHNFDLKNNFVYSMYTRLSQ